MYKNDNATILYYSQMCRDTALFFSVISILLGLSGIMGWFLRIPFLVQYQANTVAMVFNTALCFVVMGFCLVALVYYYHKTVIIGSLLVITIAGLSLLQDIYLIDLGIDQFFFKHYESVGNLSPGRMAPNTAICFILSACSLVAMSSTRYTRKGNVVGGGLAFTVLCLGLLFFLGYFSNIEPAYRWERYTPIAISSSIQFIFLSLGMTSFFWHRIFVTESHLQRDIPFIFSAYIVITFCVISYQIHLNEAYISNNLLTAIMLFVGLILAVMVGFLIRYSQVKYLAEQKIRYTLSMVRATLESTVDGIFVVSNQEKVVDFNQSFLSLLNLKKAKIADTSESKLLRRLSKCLIHSKETLLRVTEILSTAEYRGQFEMKLKTGVVLECHCIPQILDNKIVGRVWSFRDITAQKQLIETLSYQATHDNLTGLPNRALLIEMIDVAINRAKEKHKSVGIYLLDLDRFTHVNDVFGRSRGDELLILVARRIQKALPKNHILGRISGDEYIVIAPLDSHSDSVNEIEHLLHTMNEPYEFYEHQINITASIGVAFYPDNGAALNDLLSKADIALSRAKNEGRNTFKYYTPDMTTYTLERIKFENELRQAVNNNELLLYYQPVVHLETAKISGFEALLRWNHPKHGLIMPAQFIQLAEETGYIREIGDWVLRTACQQMKCWYDDGYDDLKIAINISRQQFNRNHLLHTIHEVLLNTQLSPASLELELTETALFDRDPEIIDTINACHKLNISLAIDDFGTGFSCLNYLKTIPINTLKIDQSFVKGMNNDEKDDAIVKTIIGIGENLDISILAEGIETLAQMEKLKSLKCAFGQGYYFSRPLPSDECLQLLKNNRLRTANDT